MQESILDRIESPADLKTLNMEQLIRLCQELREEIIRTVSRNGGHLAPNLGVVELTVALHRVFDMPSDKILWDVGHQTYAHKLLTGRKKQFATLRQTGGLSGFPSPRESIYDPFISGHAGTSISAALGFETANETLNKDGHVVAVVGDGALICGLSMEALNNVRSTCKNLIIIINDNKMSISRSVGAIPNYLNRIITGYSYNRFKAFTKMAVKKLPASNEIIEKIQKLEGAAKSLFVPGIFFEEMGLRYIGPVNGHRLPELIETFRRIREFNRPVIVHVITEKGAGYKLATAHPEQFHGVSGFDPETGEPTGKKKKTAGFSSAFGQALCRLAEQHRDIVGITAAMRSGTGMTAFSERFPERFYDVGMAEGHALTFAAGLAANGLRPVVSIYATFLQRALDSLYHDICLQKLPVIIGADRAGIVEDGPTHHGLYDESFALNMPGLCIMAPADEQELAAMLPFAYDLKAPVMIRYPRGGSDLPETGHAPLEKGRSEVLREGTDAVLWAVGAETGTALKIAELLERNGISCKVVNTRFLKPLDNDALLRDARKMPLVTLENTLSGTGLDMLADRLLITEKHCGILHFAWPADTPIPHGSAADLREKFGLTAAAAAETIRNRFFAKPEEQESV